MSELSEEQIINSIKPIVNARKTHKDNHLYNLQLNAYQLDAIQGLLDLYNKEKERRQYYQDMSVELATRLDATETDCQEEKEKNKLLIEGKFREVADKNSYIKDNYISKDKIKQCIEKLEIEKNFYFEKQVIQGRIDLLQALLEERN